MVNSKPEKNWELFDILADPGEEKDIAAAHSDVVGRMERAYDAWWADVLPLLENENVDPPSIAPYKKLYFQQYGGGPGVLDPETVP